MRSATCSDVGGGGGAAAALFVAATELCHPVWGYAGDCSHTETQAGT